MSKYIVQAGPGEDCNPEFAPDTELKDGFGCDGYMILAFKDGAPKMETMMGVNVSQLAKWIRSKSDGAQFMRMACAIGEGEIRAVEIGEEKKDRGPTIGSLELTTTLSKEAWRRILGMDENGRKFEGNG